MALPQKLSITAKIALVILAVFITVALGYFALYAAFEGLLPNIWALLVLFIMPLPWLLIGSTLGMRKVRSVVWTWGITLFVALLFPTIAVVGSYMERRHTARKEALLHDIARPTTTLKSVQQRSQKVDLSNEDLFCELLLQGRIDLAKEQLAQGDIAISNIDLAHLMSYHYHGNSKLKIQGLPRGSSAQMLDVARFLIDNDCPAWGTDTTYTPIKCSIYQPDMAVLKFLLDNGAGRLAGNRDAFIAAAKEKNIEAMRLLVEYGVGDVNYYDTTASSRYVGPALYVAVMEKQFEQVNFLIDHGANVNQQLPAGNRSILYQYIAEAKYVCPNMVQLLLDKGYQVNMTTDSGSTVLFAAVERGLLEVVQVLLNYGAAVNHRTNDGLSLLSILDTTTHPDLVALLERHGATL